MMSALQLGPLALPLPPLVLAVAVALGLAAGRYFGRRRGVDADSALWRMLLIGLVAARLGFVWEWWSLYLTRPWDILDIRDGGWNALAGFVAACLYGLALLQRRPLLRAPITAATLVLLVSWSGGDIALSTLTGGSREPMPALSLPGLDGEPVPLTRFVGKPTVINLWATWCPPCRREMPVLQQAQAMHPEINFVFVNQGESRADVVRYLESHGMALGNVLLDVRREAGATFNGSALPTTLFFDAQGRLISTRVGALSQATLEERLGAVQGGVPN